MFFSVEGGPRAGKTLLLTLLAARAHCFGLKVFSNYPVHFPAESFGVFNPSVRVEYRDGFEPRLLPITSVCDPEGNQIFFEQDCMHVRQEFHQELESRKGLGSDFRFGVLDWIFQLGKDRSSLAADTHDLDALDKRFRVAGITERIWAMSPWHREGDDFVYGVYDRPSLFGQVKRINDADLEWLYPYYETLHKSHRLKVATRY